MRRISMVLALGLLTLPLAQAQTMYRWVDQNGKVHYGDQIPAEYAGQGTKEMSKTGRVKKENPPAATPEQRQAALQAEARAKQEKEQEREQQRRDRALLATFASVEEIDLAEKRALERVDVQLKTNEVRTKSVQARHESLKKQEANLLQRNKPVPPDLTDHIKQTESELASLRVDANGLNKDKQALRERYAADRVRFRELKGLPPDPAKP